MERRIKHTYNTNRKNNNRMESKGMPTQPAQDLANIWAQEITKHDHYFTRSANQLLENGEHQDLFLRWLFLTTTFGHQGTTQYQGLEDFVWDHFGDFEKDLVIITSEAWETFHQDLLNKDLLHNPNNIQTQQDVTLIANDTEEAEYSTVSGYQTIILHNNGDTEPYLILGARDLAHIIALTPITKLNLINEEGKGSSLQLTL